MVAVLVYAAVSSLSLSFFATAVDSVFDPMSNLLLWRLHRLSKRLDTNKWPVGGARLTTIGNICYGTDPRIFCFSFTQPPPGFLCVCLNHTLVPSPDVKKDVFRQSRHHCRVYSFDSYSQGRRNKRFLRPCGCRCRHFFGLATTRSLFTDQRLTHRL